MGISRDLSQENRDQPQFAVQVRNRAVPFQFNLFRKHGLHICRSPPPWK